MGRHAAGEHPELDRIVDEACASIGREIEAMKIPRLAGVVLGGGYGRGEGGALDSRLSNDLDFFAITEADAPESETVAAIAAALEPVSKKWTAELGVDVDFAVKTPWRLKHDESRLMVQELLRGYFDVAGRKGGEIFSGIRRIDAAELPIDEAVRLLMNRGMGLLLAMESSRSPFINRNINKCILGAGDARLIARGAYEWKAEERATALNDKLYSAAVEWKFSPKATPVCDWEKAREVWLAAYEETGMACCTGPAARRTVRSALRWLVRRRTMGPIPTFGFAPEFRVLKSIAASIRDRGGIAPSLRRDWEVFN